MEHNKALVEEARDLAREFGIDNLDNYTLPVHNTFLALVVAHRQALAIERIAAVVERRFGKDL